MSAYVALAGCYDALTVDVDYRRRADFVEKLLRRSRRSVRTVLDLACGTGAMTALLAERGYEMIAADGSEEMLSAAREKLEALYQSPDPPETLCPERPLLLHQEMAGLDLNDTVDAAICCLDSLNYLTDIRDLRRTLERLRLFIAPGGALVFDINSAYKLKRLDGQVFLDETEDVYCVWRTEFEKRCCSYYMDIFTRQAEGGWRRDFEFHRQRAYEVGELRGELLAAGFQRVRTFGDCRMSAPRPEEERIYFAAIRGK